MVGLVGLVVLVGRLVLTGVCPTIGVSTFLPACALGWETFFLAERSQIYICFLAGRTKQQRLAPTTATKRAELTRVNYQSV